MADPVGIAEIAERLGVTRSAVESWRTRDTDPPFPEPRWRVGGRPAWEWETVAEWGRSYGSPTVLLALSRLETP